jgi:hypothetical protein
MLNQEERETNSVKAITEKCNEMFKDAEEYGTISLHTAMANVKDALKSLNEEFEKERYDEKKLNLLKQAVDRNAIILEYHLQTVCSKYRDIYLQRVAVEQFSQQVIAKSKAISLDRVEKDIVLWSSYARSMLGIKRKSLKLIFDLSEDEVKLMEEIKKEF